MSELDVGRMTAVIRDWPDPGQVFGMLRHVADSRLDDALREQPLPDGEWCVRRLDLTVDLDPERPLSALETGWADRIITALRQSLRDGSSNVVRFVRPEDAVDDLFVGLAAHDHEHAWAWHQVGLIEPGDPRPEADARGLLLSVLRRLHHGSAAALVRLVAAVGAAPVHRLLGAQGWHQASVVATRDAGADWSPPPTSGEPPSVAPSESLGTTRSVKTNPRPRTDGDAALALSTTIAASGSLAQAFRRSGLRVDESTLDAWAVLAIAEFDPVLLRRPPESLRGLVRAVAEKLRPEPRAGISPAARHAAPAPRIETVRAEAPPSATTSLREEAFDTAPPALTSHGDPAVTEDSGPRGHRTAWGGLLFLLHTAEVAGIPKALDEPPFRARSSAWVLHRLALRLAPTDPDDPAVLALAGLDDPPTDEADEDEQRVLMLCAARWAQQTADRLRTTGTQGGRDAGLVHFVARRDATVTREPGWVEVSFALTGIEPDVRRAGLDLDPGWVPWLGRVVRFRYE